MSFKFSISSASLKQILTAVFSFIILLPAQAQEKKENLDSIFKSLEIKEVVVKAKKIRGGNDTITYNASTYISKNDKVLEDLLKKMPGITVDANGQISYNGKWISEFYIEGNDMLDGNYNIATQNLNASDIASVQVMENHQDAAVLRGKQKGESPAINIRLKDAAKGAWASTLDAEGGIPAITGSLSVNLMRFKMANQHISYYKGNNCGIDLRKAIKAPMNLNSTAEAGLLMPERPAISDRLAYDNRSHCVSVNELRRLNQDRTLSFNINYLFDGEERNAGERTRYLTSDSAVTLTETNSTSAKMNYLNGNLNYKVNSKETYLKEAFSISAAFNCGHGQVNDIREHLDNHRLQASNRLLLRKARGGGGVSELASQITYTDDAGTLVLPALSQDMHVRRLYTDNTVPLLAGNIPYMMYNLGAGATLDWQNAATGGKVQGDSLNTWDIQAYITPRIVLHDARKLELVLYSPFGIRYYRAGGAHTPWYGQTRLLASPRAILTYKLNSRLKIEASAAYSEKMPRAALLLAEKYYLSFRSTYANSGTLEAKPEKSLQGVLHTEYKDVLRMLFASLSFTYARNSCDNTRAYGIENGTVNYVLSPEKSTGSVLQADHTFSKGFFKFNSKLQWSLTAGSAKNEYMIDGARHKGRSDYFRAQLSYLASFTKRLSIDCSTAYSLTQPYSDGVKGSELYKTFDGHATVIAWPLRSVSLTASADARHNSYTDDKCHFYLNAKMEWHLRQTILYLDCINLLDTRTYTRSRDNGVVQYTSQYHLRGRTLMAGIRLKLL